MTKKARMWPDFSIDCETLGRDLNAPILTIGVVGFDRSTGHVADNTFYERIELKSAMRAGVTDPATVNWWAEQSAEARHEALGQDDRLRTTLHTALYNLNGFLRQSGAPNFRVWGNGIMADIAWLEHAFLQVPGSTQCWSFRDVRDMRTLVDAAKEFSHYRGDDVLAPDGLISHRADHDAIWQAWAIVYAWECLKKPASVEDDDEL